MPINQGHFKSEFYNNMNDGDEGPVGASSVLCPFFLFWILSSFTHLPKALPKGRGDNKIDWESSSSFRWTTEGLVDWCPSL